MSKVKVAAFSISLDGFGAGPQQSFDNPLGVRGLELHSCSVCGENATHVFVKRV